MAEGADRMFAACALDLGYALCCVMPFAQPEFERDFSGPGALEPDSLRRFRGLLDRAQQEACLTRIELGGNPSERAAAYRACGRQVIEQSDVLVVVWDGQRQGLVGGTEDTFADARACGVATVCVDACAPHAWDVVVGAAPAWRSTTGARLSPDPGDHAPGLRAVVRQQLARVGQESPARAGRPTNGPPRRPED
jgi:hypothetical protein